MYLRKLAHTRSRVFQDRLLEIQQSTLSLGVQGGLPLGENIAKKALRS